MLFLLSLTFNIPAYPAKWEGNKAIHEQPSQKKREKEEIIELMPGRILKKDLSYSESHIYQIALIEGQYLKISIKKKGIDTTWELFTPDGLRTWTNDVDKKINGEEIVCVNAESTGRYRLVVTSKHPNAPTGLYEIQIAHLYTPTERERAFKLYTELYGFFRGYSDDTVQPQKALAMLEKVQGPESPEVVSILYALADHYRKKHEYGSAEPVLERVLAIQEKVKGSVHPDICTALDALALLYNNKGETEKALLLKQRSRSIWEKILSSEQSDVQSFLENLSSLSNIKDRMVRVEQTLQLLMAINERVHGPDHPKTAAFLGYLASFYKEKGEYDKVEPLLQRLVSIQEKIHGKDHPDTSLALIKLVVVYTERGEKEKAELLSKDIIEARERIFGCTPQHSFEIFDNNADFTAVEELLQQMLPVSEKTFGSTHPNVSALLNVIGYLYRKGGKWSEAKQAYQRALTIAEQAFGSNQLGVIDTLAGLADVQIGDDSKEQKRKLYQRILDIREKVLSPDHPEIAESIEKLSEFVEGDEPTVKKMLQRALAIKEKFLGADHPGITESLDKLGGHLMIEGDYIAAEALYQRALAIREKTFGPSRKEVIDSYFHLFVLYTLRGEYEKATPLLQSIREFSSKEARIKIENPFVNTIAFGFITVFSFAAFDAGEYGMAEVLLALTLFMSEQTEGKDNPMALFTMKLLAMIYIARGEYERAEPILQNRLSILEKTSAPSETEISFAIRDLALLHRVKGDYEKAESLFQRGLDILGTVLGPQHPSTAAYFVDLADLSLAKGDDEKAERYYRDAIKTVESDPDLESRDVTFYLRKYAAFNSKKGHYKVAEALLQRALSVLEKDSLFETLELAFTLGDLADIHSANGEYAKAGPLLQRALRIWEKELNREGGMPGKGAARLVNDRGDEINPDFEDVIARYRLGEPKKLFDPEHIGAPHYFDRLARALTRRGDYAAAESLFLQALASSEKANRQEHPQVAHTLIGLADLYNLKGEYQKAEPLLQRALKIQEKSFGKEHSEVVPSLTSLATIYANQGDYAKAESLLRRTVDISEKALGPEHQYVAQSMSALASVYIAKGDYIRGESVLLRALANQENLFGPNHITVVQSLEPLIHLYAAKGDLARAVSLGWRANAIIERNLKINLAASSESQKLNYLTTLASNANSLISLHAHDAPANQGALKLALSVLLQNKGRALEDSAYSVEALRFNANGADQALFDRLFEVQSRLATFMFRLPGKLNGAAYQNEIKKLEEQAEKLQTELSTRSLEYRVQSQPVTLEAVQAAIPTDATLIEFAVYHPFNQNLAIAQNPPQEPRYIAYAFRRNSEIQWLDLGEAKSLDKAIDTLRRSLNDPKQKGIEAHARAVDEMVMRPLRPLLGDSTRVLISADGNLNLIPFEALMDEKGKFLIERYSFTYLSSGRDLLRLQAPNEKKEMPLILAAPDYGQAEKKRSEKNSLSTLSFKPLNGATLEAKLIISQFPNARVLTGRRATEDALKKAVAPVILHIVTHGFFLEDQALQLKSSRGFAWMLNDNLTNELRMNIKVINPLLRSGLALAGANPRRDGKGNDGILTGLEFAGLNLWGTKLVVLSACDTGVGQIRSGEGVYGLRRALVLAGSEAQVLSLWRVNDRTTPELMSNYYKGLRLGKGRGEALRQAQLKMLKQPGRKHPYYWAAFIQSGEWANLAGKR